MKSESVFVKFLIWLWTWKKYRISWHFFSSLLFCWVKDKYEEKDKTVSWVLILSACCTELIYPQLGFQGTVKWEGKLCVQWFFFSIYRLIRSLPAFVSSQRTNQEQAHLIPRHSTYHYLCVHKGSTGERWRLGECSDVCIQKQHFMTVFVHSRDKKNPED